MALPKLPSVGDTQWLRRIAVTPLMVTYQSGEPEQYTLIDGSPVPSATARRLIRRGWVRGQKDSLFDQPQTFHALKAK